MRNSERGTATLPYSKAPVTPARFSARAAIFVSGVLLASLFVSNIAAAQDAKLIDAAKKESGKIVAYGSLESNTVEPIIDAFNKKTGLTVEYWRASATKVMDRALAELRAGKPAFDVMVNNSGAIYVMKKENVFAKYMSPSASAFPKDVIDPDLGPVYRNTPIGI